MIGDAAYESLWYDLTPSENRILLFLIMRSQKQVTITVGKFMNLSLQQFANVSFTLLGLLLKLSILLVILLVILLHSLNVNYEFYNIYNYNIYFLYT